ncbi:MAG: hypothetical protein HYZ17_08615 [Betaproteobacteria bacterium]|nr:hypothetical protein [Betaproteobacteria bacterium]
MTNKNPAFWRSGEGMREYEGILERHFQLLESRLGVSTQVAGPVFDVRVFDSFPSSEYATLVTYGLSGFIVPKWDGDGCIREDLMWTFGRKMSVVLASSILFSLGDRMLSTRAAFAPSALVRDFDLGKYCRDCGNPPVFVTELAIWLDEDLALIESYFPTFVLECFPLAPSDVLLFETDEDSFYEACEQGRIDPTESSRAEWFRDH